MLLLSQFVLLNYTTSTADIKNTFSRHASCNTCRWKTTWNSAPPSRITAVPCTQMQAGIPAKKKEKHRAPRLLALTENDKMKRHSIENGNALSRFCRPYLQLQCQFFGLGLSFSYAKTSLGWIGEKSGFINGGRSAYIPAGSSLD